MASKEESKKIESILLAFSDELIQRYYVCEQPIIKKSLNFPLQFYIVFGKIGPLAQLVRAVDS